MTNWLTLSVLFVWLGLDHSTRGLCSILLRGRMRLPSQLLHECHQSCNCANSGKSQTAPDDRHFHYILLHFLQGLIYASSNHRCTLSTRRQCPSPAVPQPSYTASLCSTLTTVPTWSSRSTATWWSERVAVTDLPPPVNLEGCLREAEVKEPETRDDWLAGQQGAPATGWDLIWCTVFMTSSWASHAVLTTTTNQLELVTEKGWTKAFLLFWLTGKRTQSSAEFRLQNSETQTKRSVLERSSQNYFSKFTTHIYMHLNSPVAIRI